jgi:hypothetical protein
LKVIFPIVDWQWGACGYGFQVRICTGGYRRMPQYIIYGILDGFVKVFVEGIVALF